MMKEVKEETNILNGKKNERRLTGLVSSFVGTAFYSASWKERQKVLEKLSSCWMTLRKQEHTGN